MDTIAWFIATLHSIIGHDKTARVIGQSAGDKDVCILCCYERNPSQAARDKVLKALRPKQAPNTWYPDRETTDS